MRQPRRRRRGWLRGAALLILAPAIPAVCIPVATELVVESPAQGGRPLLVVRLSGDAGFTLRYVHSVSHTPVWEVHRVDARGRIYVEEERFTALSAGMGEWSGRGRLSMRGDHVAIEGIHAPVDPFLLRVGPPSVDHTLIWPAGRANLSELAPGQRVRIVARRVGWLPQLWQSWFAGGGDG